MASLKVFICLLLLSLSRAAQEEDSGQYSPELYEKPYETTEKEEVTTEPPEVDTEVPEVSEEPEEVPEVPEVPDPADNALAAPVSAPGPLPLPYPLLYSAPLVYPAPHYLRIAAGFPTVIV